MPAELRDRALHVVRELRGALAKASVHTLEPDLIILDEFQRFRHLLAQDNPAGELAHHLFEYDAAKVLLLSATPYKPFTLAGEGEEDHARDLFRTLDFLANGRDDVSVERDPGRTTGLPRVDAHRGHGKWLASRSSRPPDEVDEPRRAPLTD